MTEQGIFKMVNLNCEDMKSETMLEKHDRDIWLYANRISVTSVIKVQAMSSLKDARSVINNDNLNNEEMLKALIE